MAGSSRKDWQNGGPRYDQMTEDQQGSVSAIADALGGPRGGRGRPGRNKGENGDTWKFASGTWYVRPDGSDQWLKKDPYSGDFKPVTGRLPWEAPDSKRKGGSLLTGGE